MAAIASVVASTAIANWRPLFAGESIAARDHLKYMVPSRAYLGESLRAGRIPEWWDRFNLGGPYAPNPNHGALYPPAWLVAALPAPLAADLLIVVHALLAGLGVAALARRIGACPVGAAFGGAVAVGSGYLASVAMNGLPVFTLAWTPWVAWGADRLARAGEDGDAGGTASVVARALELALLTGAQLLTAEPSTLMNSLVLAAVVVAVRARRRIRALVALAAATAAAGLLAAVLVVPALAMRGETSRAAAIGLAEAQVWSLHPLQLLDAFWPMALGDPSDPRLDLARLVADTGGKAGLDAKWAFTIFLGAGPLALAVAAVRASAARALAAASILLVLIALGAYTPVFALYRTVAFPEHVVRFPAKHLAGVVLAWSALAGAGLSFVLRDARAARVAARAAAAIGGVLGVGIALLWVSRERLVAALATRTPHLAPAVDVPGGIAAALRGGLVALAVAVAIAALLLVAERGGRLAAAAAVLAAGISFAHLVAHDLAVVPYVGRDTLEGVPPLFAPAAAADRAGGIVRVYRPPSAPSEKVRFERHEEAQIQTGAFNVPMLYGLGAVPGGDSLVSGRYMAVEASRQLSVPIFSYLYDVQFFAMAEEDARSVAFLPKLAEGYGYDLLENPQRRPRAFVAPRWARERDDATALRELAARRVSDPGFVLLAGTGPASSPAAALEPPGPCTGTWHAPEDVELDCWSRSGGYAVLLESWSRGWSATLDGAPAPVERADVLVKAVPFPPGRHTVRLTYRAPGLRLGAAVTLASLVLTVGALVTLRRQARPAA